MVDRLGCGSWWLDNEVTAGGLSDELLDLLTQRQPEQAESGRQTKAASKPAPGPAATPQLPLEIGSRIGQQPRRRPEPSVHQGIAHEQEVAALRSELAALQQALVASESAGKDLKAEIVDSRLTQARCQQESRKLQQGHERELAAAQGEIESLRQKLAQSEALHGQLESAQRQARSAAERQLAAAAETLAARTGALRHRLGQLRASRGTVRELSKAIRDRELDQRQQISQLEQARREAESRAEKIACDWQTSHTKALELEAQIDNHRQTIAGLKAKLEDQRAQHAQAVQILQSQLAALVQSSREEAETNCKLRAQWQVCEGRRRQESATLNEQLASWRHSSATLADQLDSERSARLAALQQAQDLRGGLETEIESLRAQVDAADEVVVRLTTERDELTSRLRQHQQSHQGEIAEFERSQASAERVIEDLRSQVKQGKVLVADVESRLAASAASRDQTERKLAQLTARHQEGMKELRQVAAQRASEMVKLQGELEQLHAASSRECQQSKNSRQQVEQLEQAKIASEAESHRETQDLRRRLEVLDLRARKEAAKRRKLEAMLRRAAAQPHSDPVLQTAQSWLEMKRRIERLTNELTSSKVHELKVRQRAARQLRLAQAEIERLRHDATARPPAKAAA